jgi:carbon storage regulator
MLVLSRKSGQSIVIGGNVVVTILEADGDRVKIGVEAPRELTVLRGELHVEMRLENRLAGAVGSAAETLLLPLLARDLPRSSQADRSRADHPDRRAGEAGGPDQG